MAVEILLARLTNQPIPPEVLGNCSKAFKNRRSSFAPWLGPRGPAEVASVIFGLAHRSPGCRPGLETATRMVRPRLVHVVLVVLAAPAILVLGDLAHTAAQEACRAVGVPTPQGPGSGRDRGDDEDGCRMALVVLGTGDRRRAGSRRRALVPGFPRPRASRPLWLYRRGDIHVDAFRVAACRSAACRLRPVPWAFCCTTFI